MDIQEYFQKSQERINRAYKAKKGALVMALIFMFYGLWRGYEYFKSSKFDSLDTLVLIFYWIILATQFCLFEIYQQKEELLKTIQQDTMSLFAKFVPKRDSGCGSARGGQAE